MSDSEALLNDLVNAFKERYDEGDWQYSSTYHSFRQGKHWTPCGGDTAITKEEYDTHVNEGNIAEHLAFWGVSKSSYTSYRRAMKEKGWREKLIDAVKAWPEVIRDE